MDYKRYYRNRLPHISPPGASFFVTFRLADSLPQSILLKMKEEFELKIREIKRLYPTDFEKQIYKEQKRYFGKYDAQLDLKPYGNCQLAQKEIAQIVADKIHSLDGQLYDLEAFTIMPNHVHLLFNTSNQWVNELNLIKNDLPLNFKPLAETMRLIKGASARYCNKKLGRKGQLFQYESYDHYVRNEKEWRNIVNYILNNPVKANLTNDWEEWEFSYYKNA